MLFQILCVFYEEFEDIPDPYWFSHIVESPNTAIHILRQKDFCICKKTPCLEKVVLLVYEDSAHSVINQTKNSLHNNQEL